MNPTSNDLERVLFDVSARLKDARSVLFITGAGVSADSGLPTYRGLGGLYERDVTEDQVPIEVALSGPMFATNPALTWKYLWQIGAACAGALPNDAHRIIADLEQEKADVWVVTQNVDGLHRQAGTQNLVEVHGDMYDLYCVNCLREYSALELLDCFKVSQPLPPRCEDCRGVIRPNVVLFEEMLPIPVTEKLWSFAERSFDMVFSIGTTAVFSYIQQLVEVARSRGGATIEINPSVTHISRSCEFHLRLGAAEAMRRLRGG